MTNKKNFHRTGEKRTEHGPKWENGGSDNSSVARARKKYKARKTRALRRTGHASMKYTSMKPGHPRDLPSGEDPTG